MKVIYMGKTVELWQGAHGSDLLAPQEQEKIQAGDLVLWEDKDGWVGTGGALRDGGRYHLMEGKNARLRLLPSVDSLFCHPILVGLPHTLVLKTIRQVLTEVRKRINAGEKLTPQWEQIAHQAAEHIKTQVIDEKSGDFGSSDITHAIILTNPFQALQEKLCDIASRGMVALPRQHLIEDQGQRAEDFIKDAGWVALPLGTINRCKLSDFATAIKEGVQALAYLVPDFYKLCGFVTLPHPNKISEIAFSSQVPFLFYGGKSKTTVA